MKPFSSFPKKAELWTRITNRISTLPLVHRPSSEDHGMVNELRGVAICDLFGQHIRDESLAMATRAGLFLVLEAWEEAHQLVQDLDTPEGSYWHGIVHRREPDYTNAKYWFRQLGNHPVFPKLWKYLNHQEGVDNLVLKEMKKFGKWEPFGFIDLCLACEEGEKTNLRPGLMALQHREMLLLFDHGLCQMFGKNILGERDSA